MLPVKAQEMPAQTEIGLLHEEMSQIRQLFKQMASALTRLALLEERHQIVTVTTSKILEQVETIRTHQHEDDVRHASERSHATRLEALEATVKTMEMAGAAQKASLSTAMLMTKVLWAIFGLGGLVAAFKFLAPIGVA